MADTNEMDQIKPLIPESSTSESTTVEVVLIVTNLTIRTKFSVQEFLNPAFCEAKTRGEFDKIFIDNLFHISKILNKRSRYNPLDAFPNEFNRIQIG